MSPTTLTTLPLPFAIALGVLAAIAAAITAVWLVSRRRERCLFDGVGGDGDHVGRVVVGGGGGGAGYRVEMPTWEGDGGGARRSGSAGSEDTEPFPEFVDEGEEGGK